MKDEFLIDLLKLPPSFLVSKWLLDRIPYLFDNDRELYINWKERLATKLSVDSKSMAFTGSSSCGFSLNPNKNFKEFDENSDVDIAIVSQYYFDVSWRTLRNLGTKRFDLTPAQKASLEDHVQRLIYWGTIATDKILEILPFGRDWALFMIEMSKENPTQNRSINFRIYKDYESLRFYQTNNLERIKTKQLTDNGEFPKYDK